MSKCDLEELSVNTIRTVCMDPVEEANSGHPATPMDLAPLALGAIGGMHSFEASAPLNELLTRFGFRPEKETQVACWRVATKKERR